MEFSPVEKALQLSEVEDNFLQLYYHRWLIYGTTTSASVLIFQEFIYYFIFTVFFLIAAVVSAASGNKHNSIAAAAVRFFSLLLQFNVLMTVLDIFSLLVLDLLVNVKNHPATPI